MCIRDRIVGEQAGDLIAEYVLAMKHNLGLNKILGTIHIYPTLSEMNKYVAGEWKRARKPEALINWVGKFFKWQRNEVTTERHYGSLAQATVKESKNSNNNKEDKSSEKVA